MSQMAVDLTTGSYDEDGVFSKHNESKAPGGFNEKDIYCSLKDFRTVRVIKENLNDKSIVLEGHFVGDDKRAIVIVERMHFNVKDVARIFSAESRLELKFRNNIYANYHVYPPSCFNGYDVTVIYPATDKDFEEFVDEHRRMVKESPELYESTVSPHFKAISVEKWYQTNNSNGKTLYEDQHPETGFILIQENIEKCRCPGNHKRAVCVLRCKDLLSLRDLTADHLSLLSNIKEKCVDQFAYHCDVPSSKIISYALYPPSYFPFHVFFETVEKCYPVPCETAHHLETIIFNLQMVPGYYKKVTLTYSLGEKNDLLKKVQGCSVDSNSTNKSYAESI